MSDSWKIVLPCTRAEAQALAEAGDPFPGFDEPPVIATLEPDEREPDVWRLEAHTEGVPDAATIAAVSALVAGDDRPRIERVVAQDWVTLSQAGLEPIRAGRFFVYTQAHAGTPVPPGAVAFRIDAGRAFGTGHHHTTAGCLDALDALARAGRRFHTVADIGTGTGLLAFAALSLWPGARALATDFDPVSVEVTHANAALNAVPLGDAPGRLATAVADGLDHRLYRARAPFDLVIANILAQPLIDLAPSVASAIAPGGTVLLAGLLAAQEATVVDAYREHGFEPTHRIQRGDWPALVMDAGL